VLVVSGTDTDVGIVVETVSDIITVHSRDIYEPPNTRGDPARSKIAGLFHWDNRLIAILDPAALAPQIAEQWVLD
jgi:chemotaxis signal transduction protein